MASTVWKSYEGVAAYLIDQFKQHFGLEKVEGKQKVAGKRSGGDWEIDAKGVKIGGEGFVIVECRRYRTARQKKKDLGALAYCVIDTGAAGAIMVSMLPFQTGARKIAGREGIVQVTLNPECTTTEYVMAFLNKIMVGLHEEVGPIADLATIVVRWSDSATQG